MPNNFETLQDLRNRVEAAKHTLEQTKRRVKADNAANEERRMLEAELARIQKETEQAAWGVGVL